MIKKLEQFRVLENGIPITVVKTGDKRDGVDRGKMFHWQRRFSTAKDNP